jgi:hypothetical protein
MLPAKPLLQPPRLVADDDVKEFVPIGGGATNRVLSVLENVDGQISLEKRLGRLTEKQPEYSAYHSESDFCLMEMPMEAESYHRRAGD